MKRLVRKSEKEKETYLPVNELDEADIRFDRCPICKGQQPLQKDNGFKFCPNCKSKFKTFNGDAYLVN